jgi:hypothetical protein
MEIAGQAAITKKVWIPAFAGMTGEEADVTKEGDYCRTATAIIA